MIVQEQDHVDTSSACDVLGLSRSGYYKWVKHGEPESTTYEMELREQLQNVALEFPYYGYRRITRELGYRGYHANHKRILRLMRLDNLLCVRKRFKPQTTDSNHHLVQPNLSRNLKVTDINQLWVADITYIRLEHEFVYPAMILDKFSRQCVGWQLSRHIDTQLTLDALDMALTNRKDTNLDGLIHHSDQGVQYASREYTNRLTKNGIQSSMSRRENPYDNTFAESFMKTLKYEEVHMKEYQNYNDAYKNIQTFTEETYNIKRLHSSIGYLSPNEYEKKDNKYQPRSCLTICTPTGVHSTQPYQQTTRMGQRKKPHQRHRRFLEFTTDAKHRVCV